MASKRPRKRRFFGAGRGKFEEAKHRRDHGRFAAKPDVAAGSGTAGLKQSGVQGSDLILDLRGGDVRSLGTVDAFIRRFHGTRAGALRLLADQHRRGRIGFRASGERLRSEGPGGAGRSRSIPPLVTNRQWREARSIDDRERAAIAWVVSGQRQTGGEHLAVLDRQGNLVQTEASKSATSVRVRNLPKGRDVVLHHSHPDEVSLSGRDLLTAWRQSRFTEARAYTPEGGSYAGRSLTDPSTWSSGRTQALHAVASELRVLGRRHRRSLDGLSAHLVNAELAASKQIWYRFTLSGPTKSDLDLIAPDLPRLRALIHSAL